MAYRSLAEVAEEMPKVWSWKPVRRALAYAVLFTALDVVVTLFAGMCAGPPWSWRFIGIVAAVIAGLLLFAVAVRWALLELYS